MRPEETQMLCEVGSQRMQLYRHAPLKGALKGCSCTGTRLSTLNPKYEPLYLTSDCQGSCAQIETVRERGPYGHISSVSSAFDEKLFPQLPLCCSTRGVLLRALTVSTVLD